MEIGAWSMLLMVVGAQILLLAGGLWRSRGHVRADRTLAALLVVIAGLMTPYALGYAGAYDAWPGLSFAPFAVPLAIGPLVYAHSIALTEDRGIGWPHAIAPAAQFLAQALVFPFPVAAKNRIDADLFDPLLGPLFALLLLMSLAGYGWATARRLARYEGWLAGRRRDRAPAARLLPPLGALVVLLLLRAGYDLWDRLVAPTDYFDRFGLYVLIGALGLWIGLAAWRRMDEPAPAIADLPERDWAEQGRAWIARLAEAGWWRDAELSLAALARHLGTNESHLSRALNAAGDGFAATVNALRADAAAARLRAQGDPDLLGLALDVGFGSKASFNRAFRQRFGVTPSAYRAAARRNG
jgi:AraC-like DNA-binding protein